MAASFDSGLVEEIPPEVVVVVVVVGNSCFFLVLVATLPTPEEPSSSPVRDRLHPGLDLGLKKEVIIYFVDIIAKLQQVG